MPYRNGRAVSQWIDKLYKTSQKNVQCKYPRWRSINVIYYHNFPHRNRYNHTVHCQIRVIAEGGSLIPIRWLHRNRLVTSDIGRFECLFLYNLSVWNTGNAPWMRTHTLRTCPARVNALAATPVASKANGNCKIIVADRPTAASL